MFKVMFTEEELEAAHQGMKAFLYDFGHDEADTVELIRSVLARLAAAEQVEDTSPASR
jgi:hypothetical protein